MVIKADLSSDSNNNLCPQVQYVSIISQLYTHSQNFSHKSIHMTFHINHQKQEIQSAADQYCSHCEIRGVEIFVVFAGEEKNFIQQAANIIMLLIRACACRFHQWTFA